MHVIMTICSLPCAQLQFRILLLLTDNIKTHMKTLWFPTITPKWTKTPQNVPIRWRVIFYCLMTIWVKPRNSVQNILKWIYPFHGISISYWPEISAQFLLKSFSSCKRCTALGLVQPNRSRSKVKRFNQNIKWLGWDTNVFLFHLFFTNKGHFQLAKTVTRKISTQRLYTWYDILQVICIIIALRGSRYLKETLLKVYVCQVYIWIKGVLQNFTKFTENTCASVFLDKVAGPRSATLFKHRFFLWILENF